MRVLVHCDFKTGKSMPDLATSLQLWSGAFALAAKHGCDAVRLGLYSARDGVFDWYPSATGYVMLDSDEAADAWERVERAALLDEKPRPGAHCEPCWERRLKRCSYAQVAA